MASQDLDIINWLLEGDPSIRWQTMRDLVEAKKEDYNDHKILIDIEGWGKQILEKQNNDGLWEGTIDDPEWASTLWTIDLLRQFGLESNYELIKKGCSKLLEVGIQQDGGINFFQNRKFSHVCYAGKLLAICSYFKINDPKKISIFEYIIENQMDDGGWNCERPNGATHSSFHSTLTVLDGLREFYKGNPNYRNIIDKIQHLAHEFLLNHHLYRSHTTGVPIESLLKFPFPPWNYYDVLTALDYFQKIDFSYDERLSDSIKIVKDKRYEGKWKLDYLHPGQVWIEMEKLGDYSRWNTLRAMRVLKWWSKVSKNQSFD